MIKKTRGKKGKMGPPDREIDELMGLRIDEPGEIDIHYIYEGEPRITVKGKLIKSIKDGSVTYTIRYYSKRGDTLIERNTIQEIKDRWGNIVPIFSRSVMLPSPPPPPKKAREPPIKDAVLLGYEDFVEKCRSDSSPELMMTVLTQHSGIEPGSQFELPGGVKHFFRGSFNAPTLGWPLDPERQFSDMTIFNYILQGLLNENELFNDGCPNSYKLLYKHPIIRHKYTNENAKYSEILNTSFQIYESGVVNDMVLDWTQRMGREFWNYFHLLFYSTNENQTYFLKLSDDIVPHNSPEYCVRYRGKIIPYQISIKNLYEKFFKPLQEEISTRGEKTITFYFNSCRVSDELSEGHELARTTSSNSDRSKECFKKDYESTFDELGDELGIDGLKSFVFEKIDSFGNMKEFYDTILENEADKKKIALAIINNEKRELVEHIKLCVDKKFRSFPPVDVTSGDASVGAPPIADTRAVGMTSGDATPVGGASRRERFKSSRRQKLDKKLEEIRERQEENL